MLQYFESSWETIEKKMPDAYVAGYSSFWFPPPGKADTGGFSVGYDTFDRFNLGSPFDRTLYGTETGAKQLVKQAHTAGMNVYFDYVVNHNGFRNNNTPGFHSSGGYPGFVLTLPSDVDGDFHGAFESGDWNSRLAGLMDIAQEKNHQFIRHPLTAGGQNIPNQAPNAANARFYPDNALPANAQGIRPFNVATPLAGDPYVENATGVLLRNAQWMVEVIGADGLRIDAVKHVPNWFFSNFYDYTMWERGRPTHAGSPTTPFSFGEAFTSDFGVLGQYIRKDGFGNRDVLDFPLFFAMRDVLNAGGFGDLNNIVNASVDGIDGNASDGTVGVTFVQSHDEHGPALSNVGYAYILGRPGFPIVYFNAKEFGNGRDFPKDGRGDALGGDFGSFIPKLVDVSRRYAKGTYFTRSVDADVMVFERTNSLLVGISDRSDAGYDICTVQTGFQNVTLTELSGSAASPVINANGDIPQTITIGANGMAAIRVPRNRTNATTHNTGVVMYGLATPEQTQTVSPVAMVLGPEPNTVPNGTRRMTPLQVITANTFNVNVQTSAAVVEDNALVKLDGGVNIDANPGLAITAGEFSGFEEFTGLRSPRGSGGTGTYQLAVNAAALSEGMHYLDTVAFTPRPAGAPAAYSSKRTALYIDRTPPPAALVYPGTTGTSDVQSQSFGVVANCPDFTADTMHIFFDQPPGYNFLGNVSASNKMTRTDRNEFRFAWNGITPGNHSITLVAFEPTGNSSVTRFETINAVIPEPNMALGYDSNNGTNAVNFQPLPSSIASAAFPFDFVVRVDTTGGRSFPADFDVFLDVDGVTYTAVPYNASLLPPVNRLVQNDQNLGDQWDEFRFVWRGYGYGNHNITAHAALKTGGSPPNSVTSIVNVPESVSGPTVSIAAPVNGVTFNQPTSVTVTINTSTAAQSVQAFIENADGQQLLGSSNAPGTQVTFNVPAGSYGNSDNFGVGGVNLKSGPYTVRAVAATGTDGSGITANATVAVNVTGFADTTGTTSPVVDGNISEFFNRIPLAVSAADGSVSGGNPTDFGADGSLTELHGRIANNTLYLAVRGDMFNGSDPNMNATVIYVDVDSTAGTGAKQMGSTSNLSDNSSGLRQRATNSGFSLSAPLQAQGIGFDAAVVIDGTNPLSARVFGFGSGGVAGSASSFMELQSSVAFGRGLGSYPGAAGTSVAGPSGYEVFIPLAQLGNSNPRQMAFAVVTTSDTSFPSPNTLPENSSNAFDAAHTLEAVARFPVQAPLLLNEIGNGTTDYVELFNPANTSVDLSQWSLRWSDSNGLTGVTGLGSMMFSDYAAISDKSISPIPSVVVPNIPWDAARAGSAALLDPYGLAVDYVRWVGPASQTFGDAAPAGTAFSGWAAASDFNSNSKSLSRNSTSTDTDSAADWQPLLGSIYDPNPTNTTVPDWQMY